MDPAFPEQGKQQGKRGQTPGFLPVTLGGTVLGRLHLPEAPRPLSRNLGNFPNFSPNENHPFFLKLSNSKVRGLLYIVNFKRIKECHPGV